MILLLFFTHRINIILFRADELLLTEMLFAGAFNDLTSQKAVSLLSCFVFQEKAEAPALTDEMSGLLRQMQVCIIIRISELKSILYASLMDYIVSM